MNPVGWFEIPAYNLARARVFYETVFDIELAEQNALGTPMLWFPGDPIEKGITGTLVQAPNYIPTHAGTLVYFSTTEMDEIIKRTLTNGGRVLKPKTDIGQYGYIAHLEDTEGNRIGLHMKK